jgi:hypothetical protein
MIRFILGSAIGAAASIMLLDVQPVIAISILIGQLGTVALLYMLGYIKT